MRAEKNNAEEEIERKTAKRARRILRSINALFCLALVGIMLCNQDTVCAAFVHNNEYKILWSTDFLLQNNVSVPDSSADLYIKIGEKNNNSWQCIVDKNTRKMWFEINWD